RLDGRARAERGLVLPDRLPGLVEVRSDRRRAGGVRLRDRATAAPGAEDMDVVVGVRRPDLQRTGERTSELLVRRELTRRLNGVAAIAGDLVLADELASPVGVAGRCQRARVVRLRDRAAATRAENASAQIVVRRRDLDRVGLRSCQLRVVRGLPGDLHGVAGAIAAANLDLADALKRAVQVAGDRRRARVVRLRDRAVVPRAQNPHAYVAV